MSYVYFVLSVLTTCFARYVQAQLTYNPQMLILVNNVNQLLTLPGDYYPLNCSITTNIQGSFTTLLAIYTSADGYPDGPSTNILSFRDSEIFSAAPPIAVSPPDKWYLGLTYRAATASGSTEAALTCFGPLSNASLPSSSSSPSPTSSSAMNPVFSGYGSAGFDPVTRSIIGIGIPVLLSLVVIALVMVKKDLSSKQKRVREPDPPPSSRSLRSIIFDSGATRENPLAGADRIPEGSPGATAPRI